MRSLCNFGIMKRPCLLVFMLLLLFPAWSHGHPLHLSVTNITYESGKLSISMKTFRDDWETAYFHYHNALIDLKDKDQREGPWFKRYLHDRFRISTDEAGQGLSMHIDTVKLDEDSMTIEMHSYTQGKVNSLYIYNALLTDIYPDQTNLVIFGFKNRETGMEFDVKKLEAEVMIK